MAEKRDYYEVLGIARSAAQDEISVAYRRLAMKYHPDRNPGDEEAVAKFKEAAEAFDVLNNPDKRARYDRYGHQGVDGMFGGGSHGGFSDISDIFEAFGDIFGSFSARGGSRGGHRVQRGADVRCVVELDLLEVARGCSKVVEIKRHEVCDTCHGTGAKPGTSPETCSTCHGRGVVLHQAGFFQMQTTCPMCQGAGQIITQKCPTCHGTGLFATIIEREVPIPAGIDERTQLRLAGEGERSPSGGPPGDCYITVRIREHSVFQVDGKNLVCPIPITYPQAALGAIIELPTLEGKQEFEIPPGTQHGDVFRQKNLGLPNMKGNRRGDILIVAQIEVPRKLSPEYEELLRKMAQMDNTEVAPQRKGFFTRFKDYLHSAFGEKKGE